MATSSDIISLFNKARESYTPISGPTTDENMVNFREAILTILYSIYRGADAGCLSGLIFTDVEYKGSLVTTASFDPMIGAFKLYDPSIKYDATDGLRKKMEREWTARLATQLLIRACKMGCRSFILKFIEDNWVRRLRDPDSFYTRVFPRDLLNLLTTHKGGLERADAVTMFATMYLWWAE